ncbi:MAG: TonB-dependent receptor plug domain-containing protein [Candidatus Hydrogenedens sp.]|nr:TonB-dependent receptor plug domain-containing protein [Candidatus Hydrogenedens sp.]
MRTYLHSWRRGIAFAAAGALMGIAAGNAAAQAETEMPETGVARLPEVLVESRADSLTGIADSATQGTVGQLQLRYRPTLRGGEVLETVPGVIITQHAGGGKANQYFLRGFNLDHGTDFATFLDGMPLNLPSHGHGQGYSDMNIVIPELVLRLNYAKGPYYARNGDFSSAGAAHLEYYKKLPTGLFVAEGGMYGYARTLIADSPELGAGNLLYALELTHSDGPWDKGDDYKKVNGALTYSQGDEYDGWSISARGYHGDWNSSDQIARSAVRLKLTDLYGSLDDTTGGDSQRYSLQGEWHREGGNSSTRISGYGFYYDMDLFSNFTYYLTDQTKGDQFEQADQRWVFGIDASHTMYGTWWGRDVENTIGLQLRNDFIDNGLYQSWHRKRAPKWDGSSILRATTREDDIWESSTALYYENKVQWADTFRTVLGARVDYFHFDVDSDRIRNSNEDSDAIVSPKLSLIFGPWNDTEFFLQGGLGFHSNDARGVTTRVDPVTGSRRNGDGDVVEGADPLVRTKGAEAGVRTTAIEGLQSTLSIWLLDIDSELLFVGDAGATEASRPSRRYGVEFANYYDINDHWAIDADISLSHAEFRDNPRDGWNRIGREIPGAIEAVVAAGVTYHNETGFEGSLRLRYFGERPLTEDNRFRSDDTVLLNALVAYNFNETWKAYAEVLNALNRDDDDITYAYESRARRFGQAREELHFHPVEPIQVRFGVEAKF